MSLSTLLEMKVRLLRKVQLLRKEKMDRVWEDIIGEEEEEEELEMGKEWATAQVLQISN